MGLSEIGIVENMSGLVCPHCGADIDLFGREGGERLAEELAVRFLGRIPIDVAVRVGGDTGESDCPSGSRSDYFVGILQHCEADT